MNDYSLETISSISNVIDSYMDSDYFKQIQNRSIAFQLPLNKNIYTIEPDKYLCNKTGIYSIDFRTLDYTCNTRLYAEDNDTVFANYIYNLNVMSSFFSKNKHFLSSFNYYSVPFLITIKKNRNIKHMKFFDEWFHEESYYRIVVDKGIQFVKTHIEMSKFIPIGIVGECSISDVSVLPDYRCDTYDNSHNEKAAYRDRYRQELLKKPKAHFELFYNCIFEINNGISFFDYMMAVGKEDIKLFINNKNKLKIKSLSFDEDFNESSLLLLSKYLDIIKLFSRTIVDFENFSVRIELSISEYRVIHMYEYMCKYFLRTTFPVYIVFKLQCGRHSYEQQLELLKNEASKLKMFSNVIVR